MFKNYLIMAFRTLLKEKVSSLIAILGLALGLTTAILLYFYADYQLSYDQFLPEGNNIKRIVNKRIDIYNNLEVAGYWSINNYNAELIKNNSNGIEDVAIWSGSNYLTLNINGENIMEDVNYISDNFFNMISFELIEGNRLSMQSEPNYIVISKRFADKHFPDGDALGKNLKLKGTGSRNLKITGIVKIPKNSHFYKFYSDPAYVSINLANELVLLESGVDNFSADHQNGSTVYVKVNESIDDESINRELNRVYDNRLKSDKYTSEELFTEDFSDIFMNSKTEDITNPRYQLIMIILLGVIILTVSIINTISILTAKSINRTKEVGVRIVMGSSKKDLIVQFLTESIILTLIAVILSLVLVELVLPIFSSFLFLELSFSLKIPFLIFLLFLTLVVGIISGLYPALYLSSLKPVESLKGKNLLKLGKSKKALVVFQFILASMILISTISANKEIKFLDNLDPGFNIEKLIYVFPGVSSNFSSEPKEKLDLLKKNLKENDNIVDVTYTSFIPYSDCYVENNTYVDKNGISYLEEFVYVDDNYFNLLDIEILSGEVKNNSVIIMKSVQDYRDLNVGDTVELNEEFYTVSAIVDDYFLRVPVEGDSPKFHIVSQSNFFFQLIKYRGIADVKVIKKVWFDLYPDTSLNVGIHSVNLSKQNPTIDISKTIMNITMILTIFLSILGLFGLILHRVKLKNKEIGIRKVMGASVSNIIWNFIIETMRYESIGILIGLPLGVFALTGTLDAMGYPFKPTGLLFISVISGITLMLIGCFITFFLFYRSAKANPSNALRYE